MLENFEAFPDTLTSSMYISSDQLAVQLAIYQLVLVWISFTVE